MITEWFKCYRTMGHRLVPGPEFDNAKAATVWCARHVEEARQIQHMRDGKGTVGGLSYLKGEHTAHHRYGTFKTGEAFQVQTAASLELEKALGQEGKSRAL